jgi:hypothetical protein
VPPILSQRSGRCRASRTRFWWRWIEGSIDQEISKRKEGSIGNLGSGLGENRGLEKGKRTGKPSNLQLKMGKGAEESTNLNPRVDRRLMQPRRKDRGGFGDIFKDRKDLGERR